LLERKGKKSHPASICAVASHQNSGVPLATTARGISRHCWNSPPFLNQGGLASRPHHRLHSSIGINELRIVIGILFTRKLNNRLL
jgi:hypothetical protein